MLASVPVGELVAMALLGFAYMGSFILFAFVAIAAWDKFKEFRRRRLQRGSSLL